MQKRLAAPAEPRKESYEGKVDGLLSERDRLMNEIALRARLHSLPPMLAKARTLLTRFWGRASWEARSEILAVARMLMTLGAAQPALQAQSGVPEKRQARNRRASGRQKAAQAPRKMVGDDDPT